MSRKTALITGASSGIGEALALELARRNYALALTARRERRLVELANRVTKLGGKALVYPCDSVQRSQVEATAQKVLAELGGVDLAILNAGISGRMKLGEYNTGKVEQVVNTNLLGALYWVEPLIKSMLKRNAGVLAAMSSLAASRGLPEVASYSASKAALSTFFESLRVDLRNTNVRAVTIEPGFIRTPLTAYNPSLPFLMEVEPAVKLILNRIERGKDVVRFPLPLALMVRVIKGLPSWLYDALLYKFK